MIAYMVFLILFPHPFNPSPLLKHLSISSNSASLTTSSAKLNWHIQFLHRKKIDCPQPSSSHIIITFHVFFKNNLNTYLQSILEKIIS